MIAFINLHDFISPIAFAKNHIGMIFGKKMYHLDL